MRFGVNTLLFISPFTGESVKFLELIGNMGFDGVEITLEHTGDFDCKKVSKALGDIGLGCCSLCGLFTGDRDLRGSSAQQETAKDYLKAVSYTHLTLPTN